ncbi:hypothetical protein [Streptomyces sp. NRRL S-515]|nr:hypothetical protein [Streptomyces sp. NRRL S-515]
MLKKKTVAWGNIAGLIAFLTETSLVFLMTGGGDAESDRAG